MINKELNRLHRAYGKHDWRRVGEASDWPGGEQDEDDFYVYRCACGDYAYKYTFKNGETRMVPYRSRMTAEWTLTSLKCLNVEHANELLALIWPHRHRLVNQKDISFGGWSENAFLNVFGVSEGSKKFMPVDKRPMKW